MGVKDGIPGRRDGERGRGSWGEGAGGAGGAGQVLGVKRPRREWGKSREEQESEEEETDEDARQIPMPRDTPPPIPWRSHLPASTSNANLEPLGSARLPPTSQSPAPTPVLPPPQTSATKIYESAPQVRDLRKEAVASFVPDAVRRKLDAVRGKGRLLEEDDLKELERGGYTNVVVATTTTTNVAGERKKEDGGDEERFRKEEEMFERDVRMVVGVENVDDDDG